MNYPIKTLQQLRPILIGFRKRAGMSQAAVASLLGITQQSYAKIEANPSATSVDRLFTILRLLGSEIVLTQSVQAETEVPPDVTASVDDQGVPVTALPIAALRDKTPTQHAPPKMIPPTKKKERW
jgi:HTH-type transcriptional regulator / antitoxin HipB